MSAFARSGSLGIDRERIASHGCAAPTFGRGAFGLVVALLRPKVGATLSATREV